MFKKKREAPECSYKAFMDNVWMNAGVLGKVLDVKIDVDSVNATECYARAVITRELYQLKKLNHFKSAGNFCYWIRKLKPFSITDLEDSKKIRTSILNEYLAVLIALNMIQADQEEIINRKHGHLKDVALDEIDKINLRVHTCMKDLINSMRYHVHSSGSTVTLFELTLKCIIKQDDGSVLEI